MRKKILILIIIVLSTVQFVFALSDTVYIKNVLSANISTLSVVKTTISSETLQIYKISSQAQRFMNDSLTEIIINNGFVRLSDSIVPRMTRLFGKDKYYERKLEIIGANINYFISEAKYVQASENSFLIKTLFVSLLLFLLTCAVLFYLEGARRGLRIIFLIMFVFLFFFFGMLMKEANILTVLDILSLNILVFLPSFVSTYLIFKKRERKINKDKLRNEGFDVDNPFDLTDGRIFLKRKNSIIYLDNLYNELK